MDFLNRIKKEMSEGIARAIFEDAGYRVIDSGIEKVLRELSCLSTIEYHALGFPNAMNLLPDFTVMTRDQDKKFLVEVKYRSHWSKSIFDEVRDQVAVFGEMILVSVNATAEDPKGYNLPTRFIRCCSLRLHNGVYQVELRAQNREQAWFPVDEVNDGAHLWWKMSYLSEKFELLSETKNSKTLTLAVGALEGILAH